MKDHHQPCAGSAEVPAGGLAGSTGGHPAPSPTRRTIYCAGLDLEGIDATPDLDELVTISDGAVTLTLTGNQARRLQAIGLPGVLSRPVGLRDAANAARAAANVPAVP